MSYEQMTAAELREVTQPLKGSGLWWPCAFDAVEQRWRKSSCGTPITVPEAAAMLERVCEEWLKDKGMLLDRTYHTRKEITLDYVKLGGLNDPNSCVYRGAGVTKLHALVKAVEAVGKASEPKLDAFTRRQVQSFADDVAYLMGGTKPVPPPANEPANVAVTDEAEAKIKATKTVKYKPYHYSVEITVGDMRVSIVNRTDRKTVNLHLEQFATSNHSIMTFDKAALIELRKAIDAAIERIGGGQ